VQVAEITGTEARCVSPYISLSQSGKMVLTIGSGNFYLTHEGAMCLADMLAEAAMLGEGVSLSELRGETSQ
jgi:hypothetical protein